MNNIKRHFKRFVRYYVLGSFIAVNIFIGGQALLSSSESAEVSNYFSNFISAFFHAIGPIEAEIVEPQEITLSGPDNVIIGQSKRLTPRILPLDTTDKSVYWESDDEEILEVTGGGIVVAKALGSATIRATTSLSSIYTDMTIQVLDYPTVSSFELEVAVTDIYIGTTTKLVPKNVTPDLARLDTILYSSDNELIATVNEYGVVKGTGVGSTTIRAIAGTVERTIDINVTNSPTPVIAPGSLTITGPNVGYIYRSHQLTADFGPTVPTDDTITWLTSDQTIARVDDTGLVYGYKFEGTVTITAISNADDTISDTFEMTFVKVYPQTVSLIVAKTDIIAGQAINIYFDFNPVDTYDRQLVWTSSDSTIAHVSSRGEYGLFTAIKVGTVTITATSTMDDAVTATIEMHVLKASTLSPEQEEDMRAFVRKGLGHYFLFFANGLLGYLTMFYFLKDRRDWKHMLFSVLVGAVLSSFMEALQLLAPGRSPLLTDAIINFLGYLTANIILLVVFVLDKRKHKSLTGQFKTGG